jgi:hypothetical protein
MPTGTAGGPGRRGHLQVVNTICQDINYNDTGAATGIATGKWLPAGAIILATDVSINTTFNAQTTNVLTIGLNGTTANNIVATVTASALAVVPNLLPTGTALGKLAADTQIYVKYTQTGTAATAGAATFIIKYAGVVS